MTHTQTLLTATKEITLALKRLDNLGVTPDDMMEMSQNEELARRVATLLRPKGLVYDARQVSHMLDLPLKEHAPRIPRPISGAVIIYFGGWTAHQLYHSPLGKWYLDEYKEYMQDWIAESGYYRVIPALTQSHRRIWKDQVRFLDLVHPEMKPAPALILATTAMIHLALTGSGFGHWYRCAEEGNRANTHVQLFRSSGEKLIFVDESDNKAEDSIYLAAAQKLDL